MSITTNNEVITLNIDAVQLKRNTAAGWTTDSTTILKAGEIGVELDTGKIKVGDGVKTWANLAYAGGDTVTVVNDLTTGGTTAALSAEQGKVLAGRVTSLEGITVIDCGDLTPAADPESDPEPEQNSGE